MPDGFKVDRSLQFFFHDYLDGSLVGPIADSVIGSSERNMLVAGGTHLQLSPHETLAVAFRPWSGGSQPEQLALAGLPFSFASPGNQTHGAWAVDATYASGGLKLFAEVAVLGELSPSSYVSFGPSNRLTDAGWLASIGRRAGHCTVSATPWVSADKPSGTQHLFVPGVTVAMTRNTEYYLEYALQEVRHAGTQNFTTLENGVQFLLHWHF